MTDQRRGEALWWFYLAFVQVGVLSGIIRVLYDSVLALAFSMMFWAAAFAAGVQYKRIRYGSATGGEWTLGEGIVRLVRWSRQKLGRTSS